MKTGALKFTSPLPPIFIGIDRWVLLTVPVLHIRCFLLYRINFEGCYGIQHHIDLKFKKLIWISLILLTASAHSPLKWQKWEDTYRWIAEANAIWSTLSLPCVVWKDLQRAHDPSQSKLSVGELEHRTHMHSTARISSTQPNRLVREICLWTWNRYQCTSHSTRRSRTEPWRK